MGIARGDKTLASVVLEDMGVTPERIAEAWSAASVEPLPLKVDPKKVGGQIPFTLAAKYVLETGLREALALGHNYIGTEHLLIAFVRDPRQASAQWLLEQGDVRNEVMRKLSSPRSESTPRPETPPAPAEGMKLELSKEQAWTLYDALVEHHRCYDVRVSLRQLLEGRDA